LINYIVSLLLLLAHLPVVLISLLVCPYRYVLIRLEYFRTGILWAGILWTGILWAGILWTGILWAGILWAGILWTGILWTGIL
jgi:hypothetical protein